MKKVCLSVTDFAIPSPLKGSIDSLSGFGRSQLLGMEIHQKVQAKRAEEFATYKAEVEVKHEFTREEFIFEVSGRMDGFFDDPTPRIEEIKSSFNAYELYRRLKDDREDHPYCLQLKTYGYIYYLQNEVLPDLSFHLVSSRNFDSHDMTLKLYLESFELWLGRRLDELVEQARLAEKRAARRRRAADKLQFPFDQPRSGQVELIQTIQEGMGENRPMLIQAPTGLGKTVGVLYPTLREAMSRGQRVVYITPKNSQHSVAEDAVERLQDKGANIKSLTLTAKSKMCFKAEPLCNPTYCEYAKDYYTKLGENKLIEYLGKKRKLSEKTFKKVGEEFQVCPFELQMDAAEEADTVICDYNYVFAPRSAFGRMTNSGLDQDGRPNLVIDEAHNLPSRAMDHYSPSLSVFSLEKMREDVIKLPMQFRSDAQRLLNECIEVVKKCGPKDCDKPCKIDPPARAFLEQDNELRSFLSSYLNSDVEIEPRDVVLRLAFYWSEFAGALEFVSAGRKEFFTTFNPFPATVRITCCDASEMLKHCYDSYNQIVAFSATLKPFEFYSRLGGLHEKDLKTAEFISPFPKSNRKLLIIPQISSKYSERAQNYQKIADAIEKISAIKRGNYFAFFPSFDFMEQVLQRFQAPWGTYVLKQERGMRRENIQNVLDQLTDPDLAHIVFGVQGGVFSEGVDYPGKMAIGAFVIGPPLPNFDLERNKMREYYEENYSAGFDYAFTYPAMAKAVQAAGRVIRSETDRGIIVLMDNRFIHSSYVKSMPQDWFEDHPTELVSDSILKDVSTFWECE
jgi:DNA excision repair protein ERCC-2